MDAERTTLRALISQLIDPQQSSKSREVREAIESLSTHTWHDEENRVVSECLRASIAHHRPLALREAMAAEATRKGHPDVDWNLYFAPSPADVDLARLIDSLKQHRAQ